MRTPQAAIDKPPPELLLELSDLVAELHECRLGADWAFVGEAAQDITIRRAQILVVIPHGEDRDDDRDDQPDLELVAGPREMRLGGFRVVDIQPPM